jgi:hypothetical protein
MNNVHVTKYHPFLNYNTYRETYIYVSFALFSLIILSCLLHFGAVTVKAADPSGRAV